MYQNDRIPAIGVPQRDAPAAPALRTMRAWIPAFVLRQGPVALVGVGLVLTVAWMGLIGWGLVDLCRRAIG